MSGGSKTNGNRKYSSVESYPGLEEGHVEGRLFPYLGNIPSRNLMEGVRRIANPDREKTLYGREEIFVDLSDEERVLDDIEKSEDGYENLAEGLKVTPMPHLERLTKNWMWFEVKERAAYFHAYEAVGSDTKPISRPLPDLKEQYHSLAGIDDRYAKGRRERIEDIFSWKASRKLWDDLEAQERDILVVSEEGFEEVSSISTEQEKHLRSIGENLLKRAYWL